MQVWPAVWTFPYLRLSSAICWKIIAYSGSICVYYEYNKNRWTITVIRTGKATCTVIGLVRGS